MKRLIVLGAMLAGCDDPLAEAQRIESTRVLGARVEAAGDPLRAWPEPGESATVRWLVADPRPAPPLGWAFSLCVGAPTVRGVPECDAPPFAELASPGPSAALPSFDFSMPDQATLGSADRVLIRGAICADAQPVLAEPLDRSRCEGELELVLIEVGIASVEGANLNPSLGDAPISFDGAVWPEPPATLLGASDCSSADAAPELPLV